LNRTRAARTGSSTLERASAALARPRIGRAEAERRAPESVRARLAAGGTMLVAGAHSALSAKLVEEAGFDGIWASGFEISASRAVPDANVLTMAEQLEVARQIARAVRVPVFADCDNGFGNAINAIRAVEEYESAGVAGICIEDNVFPKRCSFYEGTRRELATVEEHCGKIHACLEARRSEDFVVIARTEAFIAGWGLDEALRRGRAYADAGADLVLVHSKERTAWELEAFAKRWDRDVPLVAVPTKYGQVTAKELQRLGYPFAIFANQALRASLRAMRETLAILRREEAASAADERIATLEEVYEIVGVRELEENERAYAPASTQSSAIVLAAGYDEALMPLVADRPKCMLDLKGRTILERQLDVLRACGVHRVSIVRGYRKETIQVADVRAFDNDAYATTGEAVSLLAASAALEGRTLVLYGDVIFEREILEKLLRSDAGVSVVVDRSFAASREGGTSRPDLVLLDDPARELSSRMTLDGHSRVLRIGREIAAEDAHGEFVGLALFDADATAELRSILAEIEAAPEAPFGEAPEARRAALTDLVQRLIDRGRAVASVDVRGGWLDVDSFEDYRRGWANVGK
jgi:phosphoenolpyruvate phosphomutase